MSLLKLLIYIIKNHKTLSIMWHIKQVSRTQAGGNKLKIKENKLHVYTTCVAYLKH